MQALLTREGRSLPDVPWERYPRPQMVRKDWLCLNGDWELRFSGKTQRIRVPFCAESLLAGLETVPPVGAELIYRRDFTLPDAWAGRTLLLHFGAVSRQAEVLVNGRSLLTHGNGYLPFTADITDAVQPGENELCLRVVNNLSHAHPWGKQSETRGGMWYTPCSGIWQTVWLEPVPREHIRALTIRTEADRAIITAEGVSEGAVLFEGREFPLADGTAVVTVPSPVLWSPERPQLYPFAVRSGEDRVESYFALRTLEIREVGGVPRSNIL